MLLDKLAKLKTREKFGLIGMVIVLFLLVVDHLVIKKVGAHLAEVDREIDSDTKALKKDSWVLSRQGAVSNEYTRISSVLETFSSPDDITFEMRDQVERLAMENMVDMPSLEMRPKTEGDYCEEYYISIGEFSAEGSDLMNFLNAIEEAPGIFRVISLSISPGATRTGVKGSMLISRTLLRLTGSGG